MLVPDLCPLVSNLCSLDSSSFVEGPLFPQHYLFTFSDRAATSHGFSDGCKNMNLLIYLVKIFAAEQIAAKFEVCLLNTKKCLSSVVNRKKVLPRKIARISRARMTGLEKQGFIFMFAIMVPSP